MQNQKVIKEAFHVGSETEQISNKNKGTGIGQPANQQNEDVSRASYEHEVTSGKKDLSPGKPEFDSSHSPRDNYSFNQGPDNGTTPDINPLKQQSMLPVDQAAARQRTVHELLNYIGVLRSGGHNDKAEKVERIMHELP